MNKTILITGSTDGIGKLAAIQLAKEGHTLYLHGRNPEKLDAVVEEVKRLSQHTAVAGFVADFSDLDAVRQMAGKILQEVSHIDVLINNAGIFKSPVPHNSDGLDIRMVVNYLTPYVLTNALLPLLQKGTAPRLINLSSAAQAPVSHTVLEGTQMGSEQETYAQSKLAITMWSFYLAKTLKDISVIAVNPGSLLNTNMVREAYGHHWSSAEKGADILYALAVSDAYDGVTDAYYDNDQGRFGKAHADAYNPAKIEALITATIAMLQD